MKKTIAVILGIAALLCLALFILESETHLLRRSIDSLIYDNRNHYLSCAELPDEAVVHQAVEERALVIREIEQVHPGQVGVEIDASQCPGKADLLFWYASHQDRLAIEAIIAAETFYGVPYRLQNR